MSTSAYSSAGVEVQSAWLAGMVQAVVVQITAKASLQRGRPSKAAASWVGLGARKATSSVWLFLSAYSISNSASERAAVEAPVHGLEAAVDEAALDHRA